METVDDMCKAVPQTIGKLAHQGVDDKRVLQVELIYCRYPYIVTV